MKNILREKIELAISKIYPDSKESNFSVGSTEERFGDYSTNAAMILGKARGESPKEVAEKLTSELGKIEIFEKVEVAGPGFINFKLSLPYLQQKISEIIASDESYGNSDLGQDLKVNVEFISANPTGPLTLGNGRGGYTGDCLSNVLQAFGASVSREYYINDAGNQALALGHSVLKDEEAVYKGDYIDEIAKQIETKDPVEAGGVAAAIIMEKYIKKTVERMGIKFDHWTTESSLRKGPVEEVLGMLRKDSSLTYKKDGAVWLKTIDFGDDKDRVIIKSDGEYTYIVPDIAYHWLKIKRNYNLLIDFLGADHHGYVSRLKAGVEIVGKIQAWGGIFKILIAQLVRLMSKGQEVKMSKRAGTYVTLDELIDEVGADVTRFFFLERSLDTHMDFDLDLAKEHSEKNPVYYVQYAHARISSILAKSPTSKSDLLNLDLIKEPAELALIKELIKLPDVVIETAEDFQVQRLPFFAIELANKFHNFYEHCKVISDDTNLTSARIELIKATQIVLKKTLDLMGVSSPEKM